MTKQEREVYQDIVRLCGVLSARMEARRKALETADKIRRQMWAHVMALYPNDAALREMFGELTATLRVE